MERKRHPAAILIMNDVINTATVTSITTKGLTLLKDKGGTVKMTFDEAEEFLRYHAKGWVGMEVLEV